MPDAAAKTKSRARQYEKLTAAMERDRRSLQVFRDNRLKALKAYAGHHYSNRGADTEQPCNFLKLFVRAMVRNLVAKNPRFHLSSWNRKIEPVLDGTREWADREAERQRFDIIFQRIVLDALFSIGIAKVGVTSPSDSNVRGWRVPAGSAFIDRVGLDDWVVDTYADSFETVAYEGHRFRVPLESVLSSDLYEKSAREDLSASEYRFTNEDGDERAAAMGTEEVGPAEELEDMVDLWSVYLPRTKRLLTMAAGVNGEVPGGRRESVVLRDVEWYGPDEGPYHHLTFGLMPDNLMPPAPVQDLIFPNKVLNDLARKLVGQAGRQKTLAIGRLGAGDDAEKVKRSSDGDVLLLSDPESVREFAFGGPNAMNYQFFEAFRGLFDQLAGNLSTILGLKPLSGTARQESILDANSSATVADMAETTASFVSRTCRSWLWWEWNSPVRRMRSVKEGPQGLTELDRVRLTYPNRAEFRNDPHTAPMTRSASFDSLDVRIDPYSIKFTTPEARANELVQIMTQVIAPLMPLLQQQGIGPDMSEFLKIVGKYKDMPELAKLMQLVEPPPQDGAGQGGQDGVAKPAVTSRTYTRKSEGAGDGGSGVQNNPASAMMQAQQQQGDRQ